MDAKQAAQEERKNMEALGSPVFLTFTGFEAKVVDNKLVELAERDDKGKVVLNPDTKKPLGTPCAPGKILKLSHLGKAYTFRAEDGPKDKHPARQMVPKHAAQHWIQDCVFNWEHKVFLKVEDAGELVPASEKGATPDEVQAAVDKALAEQQAKHDAELAALQDGEAPDDSEDQEDTGDEDAGDKAEKKAKKPKMAGK